MKFSEDSLYKVLAMFDLEDAKQVNLKQFEKNKEDQNNFIASKSEEKKLIKRRDETWNKK